MKIYTVDEYADEFCEGKLVNVAKSHGVNAQQVTDWKAAAHIFIVIGSVHTRYSIRSQTVFCDNDD